ncbi:Polyphosphate kinase [Thioalkalivibrio nitratireducens DSM 14787]|uniref:Polyphosphate kinase n=1 Tax=Thioalkalivibrio nitratireducens (strain DSM 14787 / UNIQEM 213 / ALEN2) TaxID=1255043 RepID=L0DVB9_THIND|nr:polyphosphate kinase 1 [Thioalkalivibrio nitratireducens]AGA32952.1 Polyphosphate kinase [Thioalkalivibrio nitratireducens DSM 14787]
MNAVDLSNPELYLNRELSLLEFNRRVLELALDERFPLLERLRFLCISSTNLDEFFEVRVGSLRQQVALNVQTPGPDGLSAQEQLAKISVGAHELVAEQYRTLNEVLIPALAEQEIRFIRRTHWTEEQQRWLRSFFQEQLQPVLSPIGLDPAHPFPRILNKSLNFIVTLKGKDAFGRESRRAVVQAPRSLPRVVRLPREVAGGDNDFVFLSSILHAHVNELFQGMKVTGCYQFRLTRNSDLFVREEEIDDLLNALEGELPQRNYGEAVRLEIADNCPEDDARFLLAHFHLTEDELYQVHGLVNLNRLMAVHDLVDRAELKFPPFIPSLPKAHGSGSIFDAIRQQELLLHHPYESFMPVVEFIRQAARDPDVLAIKQTLYRTGTRSQLVELLIEAAQAGKEVTVVIELRARFDEEANIELANRMQDAGVHITYGVVGYKTHAKMALVVRRDNDQITRYAHLGTGNYHAGTAKAYTDYGLLTADPVITEDVHRVFQQLTGLGKVSKLRNLLQAPFTLHPSIIDRIERETAIAAAGKPALIAARMNSLIEPGVIQALYHASSAGVQVQLLVRGICCLRPGVPGVSENIEVRSVLGRFLEHSRVFYFANDGQAELFMSSADWMPRNFFRRVEVAFPIKDPKLRERVAEESLFCYMRDTCSAWVLQKDGSYQRQQPAPGEPPYSAQEDLLEKLANKG